MGLAGPPPKREDQRRRVNKTVPVDKSAVVDLVGDTVGVVGRVEPPAPGALWHVAAREWYESLGRSGQSVWYTHSDWSTAWVTAEMLSRELLPRSIVVGKGDAAVVHVVVMPLTASGFSAFLRACSQLLATEGDRRRVSVELQRAALSQKGGDSGGSVSEIDEWRKRLGGQG